MTLNLRLMAISKSLNKSIYDILVTISAKKTYLIVSVNLKFTQFVSQSVNNRYNEVKNRYETC